MATNITVNDKKLTNVATNQAICTNFISTIRYANFSTTYYVTEDVAQISVIFPNWYVDQGATQTELGSGSDITIEASIEYPPNVFNPLTFSGKTIGTIPNGENIVADAVRLRLQKGEKFKLRGYLVTPSGMPLITTIFIDPEGTLCETSATLLTNKTLGGDIVNTSSGFDSQSYGSVAILGLASGPSVYVIGTSRTRGSLDIKDLSLGTGEVCRTLANSNISFCNAAVGSDGIFYFLRSNAKRIKLLQYYNNIVISHGVNDLLYSPGAFFSYYKAVLELIPKDIAVFLCTIAPWTTSTDGWATTTNQTITANEPNRLVFNSTLKNGKIKGVSGYFDINDAQSSSFLSGKWEPGATDDGIHANGFGYQLPVYRKAIDITKFKPQTNTQDKIEFPYTEVFTFTWSSGGAKTLTFTPTSDAGIVFENSDGVIQNNGFSSTVKKGEKMRIKAKYPEFIGYLNFNSKGVISTVFPSLTKYVELVSFDCSSNTISGTIGTLDYNPLLVNFFVLLNQLTGSIPSLTKNTLLGSFQAHFNQISGGIPDLSANTVLTTFDVHSNQLTTYAGGTIGPILRTFNASSNLLPAAEINKILAAFVAANITTGTRTLTLGGTGNAAPTGQGVTDKATLITAGWTVSTN